MMKYCQLLEWDTRFFGYRIGRITENRLRPEMIDPIKAWCQRHQIDCLYLLADAADNDTVLLAEANAFHLVDIRVTMRLSLNGNLSMPTSSTSSPVRHHRLEDLSTLKMIAGTSHRDTRFYFDTNFPRELCDALYAKWIENSCHGYADAVLVSEIDRQPVGYITCHLRDKTVGEIGLVAVDHGWRGNGVGRGLIEQSLRWFRANNVDEVTVVTQGRNFGAQRLYQQYGFLIQSLQLWYHYWLPDNNVVE